MRLKNPALSRETSDALLLNRVASHRLNFCLRRSGGWVSFGRSFGLRSRVSDPASGSPYRALRPLVGSGGKRDRACAADSLAAESDFGTKARAPSRACSHKEQTTTSKSVFLPESGPKIGREKGPTCWAFSICSGQNRVGIPFWLVGEFTTHFRTYFSGMFSGG